MYILYKDGDSIAASKEQLSIFIDSGWSLENEPVTTVVAVEGTPVAVEVSVEETPVEVEETPAAPALKTKAKKTLL